MLTREQNERLTRVGPGTPMGELMRRYWMPVLISTELQADGDTLRIRLLGEDLIAFRDSEGRVGVLGAHCPHRGAALFYGRNEDAGLRCIYHGWKFGVDGRCLDMPSEPAETNFKKNIRHTAYPARERNGVVWVYMGRLDPPPPLPALEWNLIPESQRYLAKRVQSCNWAQAIEGEIDQSHVSFIHAPHDQLQQADPAEGDDVAVWRRRNTHPRFHVTDTDYGVLIGAQRDIDGDRSYWRLTQFLFPFHTMTGPYGEDPTRNSRAWIPIDDHTTLVFACSFHPLRDLTEDEIARHRRGGGAGFVGDANFLPPDPTKPFGAWWPKASRANDFFFDRGLQHTTHFSGIPEFWAQDASVQEGMGLICDRTGEHLGTSDLAIVRVRRRLLTAAEALASSEAPPPGAADPDIYRVRAAAAVLPNGADWLSETAQLRELIPGMNQSAPGRRAAGGGAG